LLHSGGREGSDPEMGRMSFTQELKALATASEGMDAGGCWREVLHLHRELGRNENALGRAAWTMRYASEGSGGILLREAASAALREVGLETDSRRHW